MNSNEQTSTNGSLIVKLVKRNAVVALVFLMVMTGIRFVSGGFMTDPLFIGFAFFCSLLWANSILRKNHPLLAVLLSLLLIPVFGVPIASGAFLLGRNVAGWEYKARGFQMKVGCNGSAAVGADGEVYQLEELLKMATNSPNADTNIMIELRKGYALAKEKAKVLSGDCAKRGHVDTYPWKTNWSAIRPIIKASEEKLYQ